MYMFVYVYICINCIYVVLSYVGGNKESIYLSDEESVLKASKVGADTVLAGRRFHSRTVLGKKEFDSIWSLLRC